jgi:hypothetical protein
MHSATGFFGDAAPVFNRDDDTLSPVPLNLSTEVRGSLRVPAYPLLSGPHSLRERPRNEPHVESNGTGLCQGVSERQVFNVRISVVSMAMSGESAAA